jgi:hypothetical protein
MLPLQSRLCNHHRLKVWSEGPFAIFDESDTHLLSNGPSTRTRGNSGLVVYSCKEARNRNLQIKEHSFPSQHLSQG